MTIFQTPKDQIEGEVAIQSRHLRDGAKRKFGFWDILLCISGKTV
jgi:hypothetical protein